MQERPSARQTYYKTDLLERANKGEREREGACEGREKDWPLLVRTKAVKGWPMLLQHERLANIAAIPKIGQCCCKHHLNQRLHTPTDTDTDTDIDTYTYTDIHRHRHRHGHRHIYRHRCRRNASDKQKTCTGEWTSAQTKTYPRTQRHTRTHKTPIHTHTKDTDTDTQRHTDDLQGRAHIGVLTDTNTNRH